MDEPKNKPPDPDVFPMDDALQFVYDEVERQITLINAQWNGALTHFMRQHGLQGQWQPSQQNRGELVKKHPAQLIAQQPAPVPAPTPAPQGANNQ